MLESIVKKKRVGELDLIIDGNSALKLQIEETNSSAGLAYALRSKLSKLLKEVGGGDKHPYMNGNVMIIPKQHKTAISKLSVDEWQEFLNVLSAVQKELKEMFQTDSFNIGINEGPDSGASIDHLHWQIIPRHRKNHTAVSVLADIQVITLSSDELKKLLSK